ncbi:MAG: hypothetical protein EWV89_20495 [Microcystis wesenbergii Mw_QC_B_20070930_S4]|nr:MAG: hypothetical protein EWV73_21325 [Microcystis wesenbergii Mw_QC_B_20070930_S4D]TRV08546.1 MAG: hypothetical protein EWV89_20495 [Microcystis wesenbergii Mw_QC_B_20070930_S4]
MGNESYCAKALQALTATLTPANVDLSFWENTLHALGTLTFGGEHLTFVTPKSGFMSSSFESLARNQF